MKQVSSLDNLREAEARGLERAATHIELVVQTGRTVAQAVAEVRAMAAQTRPK